MSLRFIFNPLSGMFDIVQSGGGGTSLSPNTSLIPERAYVESGSILAVTGPAVLFITDGNAGRVTEITATGKTEYK